MIYTSYFAKNQILERKGIVGISIALYTPKFWHGAVFKKLAPTSAILNQYKTRHDTASYSQQFCAEVLARLDPHQTLKELRALTDEEDIALLCFEKPDSFCHRHLIADWLNMSGIPCAEYEEAES